MGKGSSHKAEKAVRRFCLACQGGHSASIRSCADAACALHDFRQCTLLPLSETSRPLRAIRRYCLACAGSPKEVRACDAREVCVLWSYRFGVLPETYRRVRGRIKRQRETLFLPGIAVSGAAG